MVKLYKSLLFFSCLLAAINVSGAEASDELPISTATIDGKLFYEISTAEELYQFAEYVNNDHLSANAILREDIVLNTLSFDSTGDIVIKEGYKEWTPIGTRPMKRYDGMFDGDNHTISGLYINNDTLDYAGLFGTLKDGVIKNVGLINSYVHGHDDVGGICGQILNTIDVTYSILNCYNSSPISGNREIGGVCGKNFQGVIDSCYNTAAISGVEYVGGVCGYNDDRIRRSYNLGTVKGTAKVGGVSGYCYNGYALVACYNMGAVYGETRVGGLCGYEEEGDVMLCYNAGPVVGTDEVGGVCGYMGIDARMESCYNFASVSGSTNFGSACGYSIGKIKSCYYLLGSDQHGTQKTAEEFANGSVVDSLINYDDKDWYFLEDLGILTESPWGQNLLTDSFPNFSGKVICRIDFENTDLESVGFDQTEGYTITQSATKEGYTFGGWFDNEELTGDSITAIKANSPIGITKLYPKFIANRHLLTYKVDGEVYFTDTVAFGTALTAIAEPDSQEGLIFSGWNGLPKTMPDSDVVVSGVLKGIEIMDVNGENYFAIYNANELYWFADFVNHGGENAFANAVLMDNIVINELEFDSLGNIITEGKAYRKWTPIGNKDISYKGVFDGNYRIIRGLFFDNDTVDYVGLIGKAENDSIINVLLKNSYIHGHDYAGGVCGYQLNGGIANCYNMESSVNAASYVGGVCGESVSQGASLAINNCYNSGTVNGVLSVGGICGSCKANYFIYCCNEGDVSGTKEVGGICGTADETGCYIANCYNRADVSGQNLIGGICGMSSLNRLESCYSSGKVDGEGNANSVCGLLLTASIHNCFYLYGTDEKAIKKTAEEFADGRLAILLRDGKIDSRWGQGELYPDFTGRIILSLTFEDYHTLTIDYAEDYTISETIKKEGYTFAGWYDNEEFSGDPITLIPAYSAQGDITLYPKFISANYSLSIELNGEIVKSIKTVAYGTLLSELNLDSILNSYSHYYEGFTVSSWSEIPETMPDSNLVISGTLTFDHEFKTIEKEGETYFQISNADELYWFAQYVNGGFTQSNAILTADIKVNDIDFTDPLLLILGSNEYKKWTLIGSDYRGSYIREDGGHGLSIGVGLPVKQKRDVSYRGTFDGDNHTISGLYFNDGRESNVGLFSSIDSATIKNVGVINSYFYGDQNVGGICGECSNSTITNCYNDNCYIVGKENVGGVCGLGSFSTITNCFNAGMVSGSNEAFPVGGLGGNFEDCALAECYNTGKVSGINVAGLCYANYNNSIINCFNTGEIVGVDDQSSAAGICFENYGSIINCYNTGKIQGDCPTASICENNYGEILNCYYLSGSDSFATQKTAKEFANGSVALLLHNGEYGSVWGQDCTVPNSLPDFSGVIKMSINTYVAENESNHTAIWASEGVIYVDNAASDIYVYDLSGRLVTMATPNADRTEIKVEANAAYIVKCGNVSKKVVM